MRAIQRVLDGKLDKLLFTRLPSNMDEATKAALVKDLDDALSADDFFKAVQFEPLGVQEGLAIFDAEQRCFKVNMLHPFFANYADHSRSHEAFQLLAITEVLTEAYLFEEDLSVDQVRHIMGQRDRFLRALVFSTQLSAPVVAQLLDESRANPKGLEKALGEGMRSLSFEVSPMGQSGKPDGLALARMGVRDAKTGKTNDYIVTYEAKSTAKANERVTAKDLDAAVLKKHREDSKAQYTIVVAPAFEGEDDENSTAVQHAKTHDLTLVKLEDFERLILIAATRPLGFDRLRDEFFAKCRAPIDTKKWIEKLLAEKPKETPLPDILNAIYEMQKDSPDPAKFSSVRERLAAQNQKYKSLREQEIQDWMTSVSRFCGDLVYISGDQVGLNVQPERILTEILGNTSKLSQAIQAGSMYAAINPKKDDGKK